MQKLWSQENRSRLEKIIEEKDVITASAGFPDASIAWAKENIQKMFGKPTGRLSSRARTLFENANIKYGFSDNISSGVFCSWPHEIKELAECLSYSGAMYLMAKEAGLNDPRINLIFGLRDGFDKTIVEGFSFEHSFVDCDVGTKRRMIIDRQLSMFGYLIDNPGSRILQTEHNNCQPPKIRHYDELIPLNAEEYVDKIKYMRTPKGAIKMLEEGQKAIIYSISKSLSVEHHVKYEPERSQLDEHIMIEYPWVVNRGLILHNRVHHQSDITPDTLEIFSFEKVGWFTYKSKTGLGSFCYDDVSQLWGYLRKLLVNKDSTISRHRKMREDDAIDFIADCGLSPKLHITDKRKLEDMLGKSGVSELNQVLGNIEKSAKEFFDGLAENSLFSSLTDLATYEKVQSQIIAKGADYSGYIFSSEERDYVLNKELKILKEMEITLAEERLNYNANLLKIKKLKGSQRKKFYEAYQDYNNRHSRFSDLGTLKMKNRKRFDSIMDSFLFFKVHDSRLQGKEELDIRIPDYDMPDKPTNDDVYSIYKQVVFKYLTLGYIVSPHISTIKHRETYEVKFKERDAVAYLEENLERIDKEFEARDSDIIKGVLRNSGELYCRRAADSAIISVYDDVMKKLDGLVGLGEYLGSLNPKV